MAVNIRDGTLSRRNDGEYVIDVPKLRARPAWLEECDGYRERSDPAGLAVTRVFRCPWSMRIEAYEYVMGHSDTELVPGVSDDALALAREFARSSDRSWMDIAAPIFARLGVPVEDAAPQVAQINRVIPMQDPERPWLFASEWEMLGGEGAVVQSPFSVVTDKDGNFVADPDDPRRSLVAPAAHFVDNSQGGVFGIAADPILGQGLLNGDGTLPGMLRRPSGNFLDGRAHFRVTFRPRDYNILSDAALAARGDRRELRRYVSRYEDFGVEALPLARLATDGNTLKFAEGPLDGFAGPLLPGEQALAITGTIIPEAGVVQLPLSTITYTWHEVPDFPRAAYARCIGRVNAQPFDGMAGMPLYPPETLLCLPAKTRRIEGRTGRVTWTIQYRFAFRPQKWNRFPAGDGRFYLATWGGGREGKRVYERADFGELFKVPPPVRYLD